MGNQSITVTHRLKDSTGKTVGYLIDVAGEQKRVRADDLVNYKALISNAVVLGSGELRAKSGCRIDTICDTGRLSVQSNTSTSMSKYKQFTGECYGREYINVCKKIRRYASARKLEVDLTKHRSNSGLNTNMFKLIEECGYTVKEFVTGYLSVIQPCSLEPFKSTANKENSIWFVDAGYNTKLLVKINEANKDKPIVVSFHESNINGITNNLGRKSFQDKRCAVLIESDKEYGSGQGETMYTVGFTVQRGFMRLALSDITPYVYNGVAYVREDIVANAFLDRINNVFKNFADSFASGENRYNIGFTDMGRISFLSFGADIVNVICQIIDLYSIYTDPTRRRYLTGIAGNMLAELPDYRRDNIKVALEDKFSNLANKGNTLYINIMDALGNEDIIDE